MEIDLRQIPDEGLQLRGSYPSDIFGIEKNATYLGAEPPVYDLRALNVSDSILIQGTIEASFHLASVRSMEPFTHVISLDDYAHMEPIEGRAIIDLTPQIREDILLALPTYPLSPEELEEDAGAPIQFEYRPPQNDSPPKSGDDAHSDWNNASESRKKGGWKDGTDSNAWGALDDLET